jgi:hypothetical protein
MAEPMIFEIKDFQSDPENYSKLVKHTKSMVWTRVFGNSISNIFRHVYFEVANRLIKMYHGFCCVFPLQPVSKEIRGGLDGFAEELMLYEQYRKL